MGWQPAAQPGRHEPLQVQKPPKDAQPPQVSREVCCLAPAVSTLLAGPSRGRVSVGASNKGTFKHLSNTGHTERVSAHQHAAQQPLQLATRVGNRDTCRHRQLQVLTKALPQTFELLAVQHSANYVQAGTWHQMSAHCCHLCGSQSVFKPLSTQLTMCGHGQSQVLQNVMQPVQDGTCRPISSRPAATIEL